MEMYKSGELARTLGVEAPAESAPERAPEAAAGGLGPAPLGIENRLS